MPTKIHENPTNQMIALEDSLGAPTLLSYIYSALDNYELSDLFDKVSNLVSLDQEQGMEQTAKAMQEEIDQVFEKEFEMTF